LNAKYEFLGQGVIVSLSDYPNYYLGSAMDKLSRTGKYFKFPTDINPNSDWVWEFELKLWPAVEKLLMKHEYCLMEKHHA
jgi:hypothetical protein